MAHDVFISHSSEDKVAANQVCEALERAGVFCWIAPRDIPPGAEWTDEIGRGLDASRVLVLIFSEAAKRSAYVNRELQIAMEDRKLLIPVRLEDVTVEGGMRVRLGSSQWLNALGGLQESHLKQLVETVRAWLERNISDSQGIPSRHVPVENVPAAKDGPQAAQTAPSTAEAKMSRERFLSQCDEFDKIYFAQVLDFCAANPKTTGIEWGGKGFSLRDGRNRPLIWMFATRNGWNIQVRTLEFTSEEVDRVKEMLRESEIAGNSWKPRDLPIEKMKAIVAFLCGMASAPETPTIRTAMEAGGEHGTEDADAELETGPEAEDRLATRMNRESFLSQCYEDEKTFFADILNYCEAHPSQIVIEWGGKGFSLKDAQKRQIFWMFPREGANSKSNINARTQKLSANETARITAVARAHGIIKGLSWRPADVPFAEMKSIIDLICGTAR